MYRLRGSLRTTKTSLRLPPGPIIRYLSQDTTSSNSTRAQPKENPDGDDGDENDPDDPEGEDLTISQKALYITARICAGLWTISYQTDKIQREKRKARAEILGAHSDEEWLDAIREMNDRETKEEDWQAQGNIATKRSTSKKSKPDTSAAPSKGQVIDYVESLTRKERAMLAAAITGQVETAHLSSSRQFRTQEEREKISLGIRYEEEDRQFYWGGNRSEGAVSYGCVVM